VDAFQVIEISDDAQQDEWFQPISELRGAPDDPYWVVEIFTLPTQTSEKAHRDDYSPFAWMTLFWSVIMPFMGIVNMFFHFNSRVPSERQSASLSGIYLCLAFILVLIFGIQY
jgi:hypothetical protein